MTTKPLVIITGPTASGKTSLSESLARHIAGEIINADMGQCYTPLSIGTAKPDLSTCPVPCHLFDILDTPRDFSVMEYRRRVFELLVRESSPIIVGGSLFYLKSLFFPPQEHPIVIPDLIRDPAVPGAFSPEEQRCCVSRGLCEARDFEGKSLIDPTLSTQELWDQLNAIDPERAHALYKTDRYRIVRALQIWHKTGQRPSTLQPVFDPPQCPVIIVALLPAREILLERISQRTREIFDAWVEEARALHKTEWRAFIERKGLIGYTEIFIWLDSGAQDQTREQVINTIITKTMQYAKRQVTFWKSFEKQLVHAYQDYRYPCVIRTYPGPSEEIACEIANIALGTQKK